MNDGLVTLIAVAVAFTGFWLMRLSWMLNAETVCRVIGHAKPKNNYSICPRCLEEISE